MRVVIVTMIFLWYAPSFAFEKKPIKGEPSAKKSMGIIFFKGSFQQALHKAKKEGKMVFIDSYTNWCGPCKHLKKNIFPDENLSKFINENFVPMAINIETGEGPQIKRRYPHGTFPTLLFIKNDGKLKNKFVGLPTYGAQELLNFAKFVSK
jgi:thioredoxin 1